MNNFKYIALFLTGLTFVGCDNEFDNAVTDPAFYTAGEADFSKFVVVGNSLTAGFADLSLYLDAQTQSFPAIMAQQFELVGGGPFNQPLVNDNSGGLLLNGTQIVPNRLVLSTVGGSPSPRVYTGAQATTDIAVPFTGPNNNFGVPGAKSFHLVAPGYGNIQGVPTGQANPYFARFASSPTTTVIADAAAANGTFFALWIGNNDVLSYATSGGVGVDRTGSTVSPTMYGGNDITDPNVFASAYTASVNALVANGAKGALINLPSVTSIPFFTTVPWNAIPVDATTAAGINMSYAQYNGAIAAYQTAGLITVAERNARTIRFVAGQNGVVILDKDLTTLPNPTGGNLPNIRQTTARDLITFPTATVVGTRANPADPNSIRGVAVPLEDSNVLTEREQARITAAQTRYNATIQALATANNLALVDVRTALQQVATTGVPYNGGVLRSTYATGGGFSLDGVHPTPRGYAFTANVVLDAINAKYGSTVPKVDIGTYRSVQPSNSTN